MALVDILIPTNNRLESFIMTLSGVAAQTLTDLKVIVSDQSDAPIEDQPVVRTLRRVIEARGGTVEWQYRYPSLGVAEQRDFLLKRARTDAVLYLDDDVLLEPWVVAKLLHILNRERCGFVGAFPNGLSYQNDVRPEQQVVELWEGPVRPEIVEPESREWERWKLHRAANLYHASRRLAPGEFRLYKVAWVASCILYDRRKLEEVGGFAFWRRLPRWHSGEEVLVQNLLMRRFGGCAIMPSGAYYAELSSTVLNDAGKVDGHALELLPEMVGRYGRTLDGGVKTDETSRPKAEPVASEI